MKLTLKVWRQTGPRARGDFVTYEIDGATGEMSFPELLDLLNERLIAQGSEPIAFESDCREGICGACGLMINGQAHGPQRGTATCQLHLRRFADGDEIVVEPFRSAGFPVIKDLVVDRGALDRIVQAGGYITAPTGSAPDANLTLVPKADAERAMDAAACIGCGACVAACPNGAGQLFTAPSSPTSTCSPGPARAPPPRAGDGGDDGGLLRQLHEPPGVRGGVPEGDQHRLHRDAQPRLPQGEALRMNPAQIDRLLAGVPPPSTSATGAA
jgi:succinate dehydrogenase iron-sulfur subunit